MKTVGQNGSKCRDSLRSGPRTQVGKRRSRYNALKRGIFAKGILLASESRNEYEALVRGLQQHLKPKGTLEIQIVDYLAGLFWRQGRFLRAECAEVEKGTCLKALESVSAQSREAWDQLRAGETVGGVLRNTSNPLLIEEAVGFLKTIRHSLKTSGFQNDYEWLLRKLYGLDHDGSPASGVFFFYQVFSKLYQELSKLAADPSRERELPCDPEVLKSHILRMLDHEISGLEVKQTLQKAIDQQTRDYEAVAALVPSQDISDRLIRYEAHLSREIDRTLNRLERVQKIRQGHPMSPTVRLEI